MVTTLYNPVVKQEGIREGKLEIAKKMLQKGMDIDTIVEVTGLTEGEVEKIKQENAN